MREFEDNLEKDEHTALGAFSPEFCCSCILCVDAVARIFRALFSL
jgi:hypothetical protein